MGLTVLKEPKTFLSDKQIRDIKADIASEERMLRNPDTSKYIMDRGEILKGISKKQKILHDHVPEKLTGESANKLYAHAKKLAAWIAEYQPTKKELFRKPVSESDDHTKIMDFERAVKHQVEWMKKGQKAVETYRYIMRRLDPENPNIGSVEQLRR